MVDEHLVNTENKTHATALGLKNHIQRHFEVEVMIPKLL